MGQDPELEKLEMMAARIHDAESTPVDPPQSEVQIVKGSRIGFDFVGSVLGCALLGWLADKALETQPWCLIVMIVVGFAVGMINLWKALDSSSE